MKDQNETPLPKLKAKDIPHTLVRAGLGAIPFAGATAAELFNLIVAPPIEKRKNAWLENISNRLSELEASQGIILETLKDNESFINVVFQASQSAIRTNDKIKLEALENAVINSALPDVPEDIYLQIYLALIDDLSTMHVRVLNEISGVIMNTDVEPLLGELFRDFPQQKELYLHVWNDLLGKQLIHTIKNADHRLSISRTKLGHGFIGFISKKDGKQR